MVFVKNILICFILLFTVDGLAQVNRYMVFFKDKSASGFSVSQPSAFLSERAISRRIKQGIPINEQDIPVSENYVQGVRATGAEVYFRTKWFNGLLVQCDQSLLPAIQLLPYVNRIELVAPLNKLVNPGGRTKFNLRKKNGNSGSETANQLNMLGINSMHADGFKGEGMVVAILDAGFPGVNTAPAFQHLFTEGKIDLDVSHDFVYNTTNVFQYDDHGTQVFSVIAAEVPDVFSGGAPEATFQLYVTEDSDDEHRIEEYNWAFAAERADSAGADVINSSLGYYDFDISSMNYSLSQMDGKTTVVTRAAQWAADRGILVVVSAGNEGNIPNWRIITAPADAFDVLAVAGVDANKVRSNSSSVGPSSDGRIKPDVAARGVGVKTITPGGGLGSATGTSLSAPLITSFVTGVWQRYPHLSNKDVMMLAKASASQADAPDNFLGYGIPNYSQLVSSYEDMIKEHPIDVYPNPVKEIHDTINIRPLDPTQISAVEVELISSIGQTLLRDFFDFNSTNRTYQIDVSSIASGIYYVRVWHDKRRYVFRIVRE